MPLRYFITKERLLRYMKEGIRYQKDIAEAIISENGGTCSQGTVNYYFRKFGISPDVPAQYMRTGLDIEALIDAWDLNDPKETQPSQAILDTYKVIYPKKDRVEDIVVMVSDLQIGACTVASGYDPYPEETIQMYVDQFCSNLINMFATRELDIATIHIGLLGDIVDGELMFPKHKTIDMDRQTKIATRTMRQIIEVCRQYADNVKVHTVAGNHGRITKSHWKSSNYDNMVYNTLELVYEGVKDVSVSTDRAFVQRWEIGKWKMLATHGDIIMGMITRTKAATKSNGFHRRLPHDVFLMGHFHTTQYFDYNRMPIITNGCMYDSDLIQNELAGWESKKHLLGIYTHNMSERQLMPTDLDGIVSEIIKDYSAQDIVIYFSKWLPESDYISHIFDRMGFQTSFLEPNIVYNLERSVIIHYFLVSQEIASEMDISLWLNDYLKEWEKGERLSKEDSRRSRLIKIIFI